MKISKKLILWAAILVIVFVQSPHLAKVFADFSDLPELWMKISHGALFAIAIDVCVLLFAIRGREWWTGIFMVVSYVITLRYYLSHMADWFSVLIILMISAAGVLAVFFLSKEVNKIDSEEREEAEVEALKEIKGIEEREGAHFTGEDIEVIKLKKDGKTHDEVVGHFDSTARYISHEDITDVIKRFKSLYEK